MSGIYLIYSYLSYVSRNDIKSSVLEFTHLDTKVKKGFFGSCASMWELNNSLANIINKKSNHLCILAARNV